MIISRCLRRNAFTCLGLTVLYLAMCLAIFAYVTFKLPRYEWIDNLYMEIIKEITRTVHAYTSAELAVAIFLNNTSMYWYPLKLISWLTPFLGFLVVFSALAMNGGLLGFVLTQAIPRMGLPQTLVLILPHGVIEIPAMIFMFSAMFNWQVIASKMTYSIVRKKPLPSIARLKDVIILSILSIFLFFFAAIVEAFVTPLFVV